MFGHPIKSGDWRALGWEITAGLELGSSAGGWWLLLVQLHLATDRITTHHTTNEGLGIDV